MDPGAWDHRHSGLAEPFLAPSFEKLRCAGIATDIVDVSVGHQKRAVANAYEEFPASALQQESERIRGFLAAGHCRLAPQDVSLIVYTRAQQPVSNPTKIPGLARCEGARPNPEEVGPYALEWNYMGVEATTTLR